MCYKTNTENKIASIDLSYDDSPVAGESADSLNKYCTFTEITKYVAPANTIGGKIMLNDNTKLFVEEADELLNGYTEEAVKEYAKSSSEQIKFKCRR